MSIFVICAIREVIRGRSFNTLVESLKSIDYFTLGLLAGLFIVIAAITEAGVVKKIAEIFVKISGDNVFLLYTLLVWVSVLLSAFIDNIPYVATMLSVVSGISEILGIGPTVLYFGLLSGATLGSNLTPIGASANITGLGILRKEGCEVSSGHFMDKRAVYACRRYYRISSCLFCLGVKKNKSVYKKMESKICPVIST